MTLPLTKSIKSKLRDQFGPFRVMKVALDPLPKIFQTNKIIIMKSRKKKNSLSFKILQENLMNPF